MIYKVYTTKDLIANQITKELFNKQIMDKRDIKRTVLKVLNEFEK